MMMTMTMTMRTTMMRTTSVRVMMMKMVVVGRRDDRDVDDDVGSNSRRCR